MNKPLSSPENYTKGRPLQVAVLTNPRSGGNKKGGRGVRKVLAASPEVMQREAVNPDSVSAALADFAHSGIELVVINGGDGTAQAALTALGKGDLFPRPPLLALLCAGTTSMLPRDVGIAGSPARALPRVLAWAKAPDASLAVRTRPVLRVERTAESPLFGMFFGAGAICQGIRAFHNKDNPMGWRGQLMPAVTMLRLLLAILRKDQTRVPPFLARIGLDDLPAQKSENLFLLISTLERLFLGIRPYWGSEDGPMRYTAVAAEPKCLMRVMPSLFRSEISRHATPENGFVSHNVHKVQLDMDGDFTLDGELYSAGEGPVAVMPAGPVNFLCSR